MALEFGTLPAGARSERVAARSAIAAIPGGVQGLLQFAVAAGVAAPLSARLLGDSPRKSMQAMLERVTDPGQYQNFQHFITHATWEWARCGGACWSCCPCAKGCW